MSLPMQHGGNVFALARQNGWDWREVADFSASINPLGPSPLVRPAILAALDRIAHYPEADACGLRQTIAGLWQTDPAGLMLGNGATDLLHFFARALAPSRVALAAPVFSEFHRAFPEATIAAFEPRAWPQDGLLVVTRPANPTGQLPDLEAYLSATTNPVLIDESFIEFTGEPSLTGRAVAGPRPNLFVLRSLTKFHAIPGLRAGVLAGPPAVLHRWSGRREPWQLNVLAEAAVRASLDDHQHAARTIEFVAAERKWLTAQLSAVSGLAPQPSSANYILVAMDRAMPALDRHKVLVRDCSGWPGVPYEHAMRVAVRTHAENLRLIAALRGESCEV